MRRRATIIADAHSTARLLFSSRRNTLALESITACLFVGSVSMALSPVSTAHSSLAQRSIQTGSAVMCAAITHNLLSATHPDTVVAAPVLGDLIAASGTPAWARLVGNTT